MKIIVPIQTTAATLDSSSITASTETAWTTGTYSSGETVLCNNLDGVPHIYTWTPPTEDSGATADSSTPPTTHSVVRTSDMNSDAKSYEDDYHTYWIDKGPTNRWSMFDLRSRRTSTDSDEIEVEITPGELFNGVALINVESDSVTVVVDDPTEGEVYSENIDMLDLWNVYDEWTWCFAPIYRKQDIVLTDIPPFPDATLTITATDTGKTVQIGECVVGLVADVGAALYGVGISIDNYSTNTVDNDGYTTLKEKTYAKELDFPVRVDTADLHFIQRIIASLRATPAVYLGVDERQETIIYGTCESFDEVLSGPIKSDCNIKVKELSA